MSEINNMPIGVFDSGVGGLTVVKQIMAAMPHENMIYFGDCARAPYGDRPSEQLAEFSRQIIDFLSQYSVKALVVACGTISARIFDTVANMTDVPIIGMVAPGASAAANATKTGKIGVMATAGTIASGAHKAAITAQLPAAQVFGVACPLFVPLVEEGWVDGDIPYLVAQKYADALAGCDVDTVLLGCTHYPLLWQGIKKALPNGVCIIDPAVNVAEDLKKSLHHHDILRKPNNKKPPQHRFYVSGSKEKFDKMTNIILGQAYDANIIKLQNKREV